MKYKLLALGIIVLGMVAFGTSPAAAQTAANGPYYATPSWDQKLQCDTTATCPRFIVLSNWGSAAVLDRETGLVWERSPSTATPDWYGAQTHCNGLMVGNRVGWRLPTVQELASLGEPNATSALLLPAGHPFTNVHSSDGAFFWSATTFVFEVGDDRRLAWIVVPAGLGPGFGALFIAFKTGENGFVWCARGGKGVDPQ